MTKPLESRAGTKREGQAGRGAGKSKGKKVAKELGGVLNLVKESLRLNKGRFKGGGKSHIRTPYNIIRRQARKRGGYP